MKSRERAVLGVEKSWRGAMTQQPVNVLSHHDKKDFPLHHELALSSKCHWKVSKRSWQSRGRLREG